MQKEFAGNVAATPKKEESGGFFKKLTHKDEPKKEEVK
jgi:hypothetical protein